MDIRIIEGNGDIEAMQADSRLDRKSKQTIVQVMSIKDPELRLWQKKKTRREAAKRQYKARVSRQDIPKTTRADRVGAHKLEMRLRRVRQRSPVVEFQPQTSAKFANNFQRFMLLHASTGFGMAEAQDMAIRDAARLLPTPRMVARNIPKPSKSDDADYRRGGNFNNS